MHPNPLKKAHKVSILENMNMQIFHDFENLTKNALKMDATKQLKQQMDQFEESAKEAMAMVIQGQKQALGDEIKKLQELIESETDPALKSILEQEKAARLKELMDLNEATKKSQTTQTKETTQEQTQETLIPSAQENQQPTTQLKEKPSNNESSPPILAKDLYISNPSQVVLHNDIYKVNLGKLSAWENNLLFALFNKLKDNGDTLVHFTPQEIKELIGNTDIGNKDLTRITKTLWNKIKAANFWILLPKRDENHMLFRTFAINYHDDEKTHIKSMEVSVNHPYFTYLLNGLQANFTSFQLQTFMSFRSKYAKTLYRLLVRFEDVKDKGACNVLTYQSDFEGFKEFMGFPKSLSLSVIEKMLLIPACRELGTLLDDKDTQWDPQNPNRDLPYETIFYVKHKKGSSHKVVGITFHFTTHPHIELQKAILKRNSQNRIQAEMEKQKMKKEIEENKAARFYYNKQERKTLRGFINSVGSLTIFDSESDFMHRFESVKLVDMRVGHGDCAGIICQFQIINPSSSDTSCASRLQVHAKYFPEAPHNSHYFTHHFVDYEEFIRNFGMKAK